jgi:hypothetical protein
MVSMAGQACDGCLGNRHCWVCLGVGLLDQRRPGIVVACHRCYGTGLCDLCQTINVEDLGSLGHLRLDESWSTGR